MSEEQPPDPGATRDGIVFLALLVEGGLVGLAILAGWLLEQPPLSHFSFHPAGLGWGLLATAPLLGLFLLMSTYPVGPLRKIKTFTEDFLRPMMSSCTMVDLFGISCLAGMGEEMLFRGFLQDALSTRLATEAWSATWWLAVLLASFLFGLCHPFSITYILLGTLMGVYLGCLYQLTGNLLAPMVTHAAYDFLVLVYVIHGPGSPLDWEER